MQDHMKTTSYIKKTGKFTDESIFHYPKQISQCKSTNKKEVAQQLPSFTQTPMDWNKVILSDYYKKNFPVGDSRQLLVILVITFQQEYHHMSKLEIGVNIYLKASVCRKHKPHEKVNKLRVELKSQKSTTIILGSLLHNVAGLILLVGTSCGLWWEIMRQKTSKRKPKIQPTNIWL